MWTSGKEPVSSRVLEIECDGMSCKDDVKGDRSKIVFDWD